MNTFPHSMVIDNGEPLFNILGDESKVLKGIHILSEQYAQIEWENAESYQTRRHSVERIHSPCHKFPLFHKVIINRIIPSGAR